MRILLLRTWLDNIGNGFIDKGARVTIERAFPGAEIIEVSGYPNRVADRKRIKGLRGLAGLAMRERGQLGRDLEEFSSIQRRMVNLAEFVDADLAVLAGCVLDNYSLRKYMPTLQKLRARGVPLLFLGAGGSDYTPTTSQFVKKALGMLKPVGIITRDSNAHKLYSQEVKHHHNGIDCVYFINDWYQPPTAREPFVAFAFDKAGEPAGLPDDVRAIRLNHSPFGDPHLDAMRRAYSRLAHPINHSFYEQDSIFVSDLPEDYLFVYANARETHSDRVHACLPALAYGKSARFYWSTPRGALFEQVGLQDIGHRLVTLDQDRVKELKRQQVGALRAIVQAN